MRGGRNESKLEKISTVKDWVERWKKRGFRKHIINDFPYLFPSLVNRSRCFTYNPGGSCIYCGNKTFRYYSKSGGKKYYQCEKCEGINH